MCGILVCREAASALILVQGLGQSVIDFWQRSYLQFCSNISIHKHPCTIRPWSLLICDFTIQKLCIAIFQYSLVLYLNWIYDVTHAAWWLVCLCVCLFFAKCPLNIEINKVVKLSDYIKIRFSLFAKICYVKVIWKRVWTECIQHICLNWLSDQEKEAHSLDVLLTTVRSGLRSKLPSPSPSPHSTTLFPSRCSSSPYRSVFRTSVSSLSVVGCGLCRVRKDRALLAAKTAERETERMLNWLVWLYIYSAISQAKHMGRSGAGSRCIKTTFWECVRVEGWFPVRVSAEPCAELWRHRWRFWRVSETRPEGTEDLRRRSAQPTLVFQCGLTFVGLELVIVGLLGEEKKKKKQTFAGQAGIILKDREFGFKVCWIWTPRAAPGDLLWHGSSQFLDTETGFLSVTRTSP